MKICIVSQYFPPRIIGGGEYAADMTAKALAKQGQNVDVLTSHPRLLHSSNLRQEIPIHEVKDNIVIHRILGLRTLKFSSVDLTIFSERLLFFLYSFFVTISFVKNEKTDIIHAMNIESIPSSIMAARLCGIPIVVTINSNVTMCPKGDFINAEGNICHDKCGILSAKKCLFAKFQYRPWRAILFLEAFIWYFMVRLFASSADKIIAISSYVKEALIKKGIASQKIEVIPEMISLDFLKEKGNIPSAENGFASSLRDKSVLYAGAIFDYRKGSHVLIEAMPIVLKELPNTKFIIAGTVPKKEKRLIEEKNLSKNIVFTKLIPREKMPAIYDISDVVVFPNVAPEPFGLVLTETMGRKKPVIASNIGGIPEIVKNEVNGLLVTPNDANDLAKAIVRILTDEKLAKKLSESGSLTVKERFSEQTILRKLITVYQELLGGVKVTTNSMKEAI
jgi:glycosyltransferase involved in cell wall biosynthesis